MTRTSFSSRWWPISIPTAVWLTGALALVAAPVSTGAQDAAAPLPPYEAADRDWSEEIPAHIAVVDGRASLERDGSVTDAEENVPLLAGDRLRTERGRVEVLFADGSVFDLDEDSALDFQSDELVRLLAGRVRISIPRSTGTPLDYRVDTVAGSALLRVAGEYRITLDPRQSPQVDVAVYRGVAELINDEGRTVVRAGSHAYAHERAAPSVAYAFNSAAYDPLDRWADDLRGDRYGAESAQYLPADLRYYSGALDDHGRWLDHAPYGRVWFPRVHSGWRPYSVGRWSVVGRFGWFWVGADRWSYVTHHYGRWQYGGGSWFWIPNRHWAPAWVSWGYTRDYVSWCPLGFDGRPAIAFYDSHYDPWLGWTVVPAHVFVRPVYVRPIIVQQVVIPVHTWTRGSFNQFVVRASAPTYTVAGRAAARPLGPPTRNRTGIYTGDAASVPNARDRAVTRDGVAVPTKGSAPTVIRGGRTDVGRTDVDSRPAVQPNRGAAADPPTVNRGSRTEVPNRSGAGTAGPAKSAPSQAAPPPDRGSRSEPPPSSSSNRGSRTETAGSAKSAPPANAAPPPSRTAPAPASKGEPAKAAPPPASSTGGRGKGGGGVSQSRAPAAAVWPQTPVRRSDVSAPRSAAPAQKAAPPAASGPRYSTQAPSSRYSAPAPRYSAPSSRNPASSPRYPAASSSSPRYSTQSSPRYSAPSSAPKSSAPASSPRYSAPAQRYSSPASAPRSSAPSPRYSAPSPSPRSSAPAASPRSAAPSPKASAPASQPRSAPASRAPAGRTAKGGGQ